MGSGPDVTSLEITTFAERLGDAFRLVVDDSTFVEASLIDVTPGPAASSSDVPNGRRAPFSIVFRGPRSPEFAQRIYRLWHPELGSLELFLVPIGPDASGMCYEAVFG